MQNRHVSEHCQWCQDGNHVHSPMPDYPDAHVYVGGIKWTQFTKRTDDPKLAWLERRLREMGIPTRRSPISSFHGPIMEVPEEHLQKAWDFLGSPFDGGKHKGKVQTVDDVEDDDPAFHDD